MSNNSTTTDIVDRNDDATTNTNQSNNDDDDDNNEDDDDNRNSNNQEQQQQQRHMNDTTMPPPPSRQQQQQQEQQVSSLLTKSRQQGRTSSNVGGNNNNIVSKSAAEIALGGSSKGSKLQQNKNRTGFGLNDWTHLLSVTKDIVQLKGQCIRTKIHWNEIQIHNTIHDGWIVLYNSVYNITPYIPYHPGGINILKSILGNDATILFNKYHRWVNIDGLIGKLLIGHLDPSSKRRSNNDDEDNTTDSD